MMRPLPPLNALRVLETLWRTGSATAAAEELHVSHSAISHHLGNLDRHTEAPLIRREGRRLVLTTAGQALGKVLNESFIAIAHEIDMLALRERAPVTISASPMVISGWVLPRLESYQRKRAKQPVHFQPAFNDMPIPEGTDIAIRFSRNGEVPSGAHRLFNGRAIPVATPQFLARHPIGSAQDIADAPCIHDEDSRMWPLWYAKAGVDPASAASPVLYANQASLALDIVATSQVIGLCRAEPIARKLADGLLVALSDISIDDDACYFLQARTEDLSRPAAELTEFLLS